MTYFWLISKSGDGINTSNYYCKQYTGDSKMRGKSQNDYSGEKGKLKGLESEMDLRT